MSLDSLLQEFPPHDKAQWRAQIEKDLRGKAYEELTRHSPDGLPREAAYHREDLRLAAQPLKEHPKWDNLHPVWVKAAAEANAEALRYLQKGATGLIFYLQGDEDLERLLRDIQIEYICLHLVCQAHPLPLLRQWEQLVKNRALDRVELEGSIQWDPLVQLAIAGQWHQSEAEDMAAQKALCEALPEGLRGLSLSLDPFAEAGASQAQQLGIALALATEYQLQLALKEGRGFWWSFAIGSDYFGEIAKLRAFRRLWHQWQDEMGWEPTEARILGRSLARNKSLLDRYNNLIRSTAEAMAAVIGGASELLLQPFELGQQEERFFPQRLALNQLSILQHESYFHQVRDMAGGSYFIENLTEDLAEAGWTFFRKIEDQGGYLACLKTGWLQEQIEKIAAPEQAAFEAGEKVIVGANRYANAAEDWNKPLINTEPSTLEGKPLVRPLVLSRLAQKREAEYLAAQKTTDQE